MRPHALSVLCIGIALGVALPGCGRSFRSAEIGDKAMYPTLQQSEVLNVQVFRQGTEISFTNTSAREFGPCRMWLNQWFSREVDSIAIGETKTLDLSTFEDRYGEPFRAGGFFATRRAAKVVLAQIESEGKLIGLIVVENKQ